MDVHWDILDSKHCCNSLFSLRLEKFLHCFRLEILKCTPLLESEKGLIT